MIVRLASYVAGLCLACSAALAQVPSPPDGRITSQCGHPVAVADAGPSNPSSSLCWEPYKGDAFWLHGATWRQYESGELATSIGSGLAGSAIHDVFLLLDNGAPSVGIGPAWDSWSVRGSAALTLLNGFWLNAAAIQIWSNGNVTAPAETALWVGTIYIPTPGQLWLQRKPGPESGGSMPIMGLCNAYNQEDIEVFEQDATTSWSLHGAGMVHGSSNNRIYFVSCDEGTTHSSRYVSTMASSSAGATALTVLIDTDGTCALVGGNPTGDFGQGISQAAALGNNFGMEVDAIDNQTGLLGLHWFQACEEGGQPASATVFGNGFSTLVLRTKF